MFIAVYLQYKIPVAFFKVITMVLQFEENGQHTEQEMRPE
jgi:hypothetical protein